MPTPTSTSKMLSRDASTIRRSQSAGSVHLQYARGDAVDAARFNVAAAAAGVNAVAVTTSSSSESTSSSCGSASGQLDAETAVATVTAVATAVGTAQAAAAAAASRDSSTQRKHTNSVKYTEDRESASRTTSNVSNDAVTFRRTVSESASLTASSPLHAGSPRLVLENGLDMSNPQERSKDAIFPSLPDLVLKQLGLLVKAERETFTELDIENRFISLALAFKTDLLTLSSRLELQKRQRDQAEINMVAEVQRLKAALYNLSRVYIDSDSIELLDEIHAQVDILQQATDRVSGSAELFGAVQQEHRLSRATEVLVSHVENIKRSLDKMNVELEEVKRVLAENNIVMEDAPDLSDEPAPRTVRYRSLAAITAKKLNAKRRASIAAMPRPLTISPESRTLSGLSPSGAPLMELRPRSHMANVVNSMRLKSSLSPILALATSTVDICEWPENGQPLMGDIDELSESQREKRESAEATAAVDDDDEEEGEVNNNTRVDEDALLGLAEGEATKLPRLSITDAENNTRHVMDDMHLDTTFLNPIRHFRRGLDRMAASSVAAMSTYVQRHRTAILRKMRFYLAAVLFAAAAWFLVWIVVSTVDDKAATR